ncbi:N-acetylmuramoyl-L-alanine amidase [Phaeobacter sp. PT47_59]|uniref:N-acetylmuramoyl-L-alanine amidase n=1 Tax=Phaeobacter sp. PT47_59 TaxID=3029979 RepID=UPI00238099B7|nr:N-acetylmuramoyl-L-alanine amidase [Phaeobacter sp. PT47_59]MDE4175785.1 N-acetylmuramoyl-L-alanine amidase [Phaeobacter sp. PT47_59]
MGIQNGKLTGVEFQEARWIGPAITPDIVVLHDTASRLEEGNAASYLKDNDAKVSVHFVIERDGKVVQQVPVNHQANHAGRSEYHGRKWCNGFAIGIELVNPGRMRADGEDWARTWYGEAFSRSTHNIAEVATAEHGSGLWMPYTEAQLEALLGLLQKLFANVSTLRDITTHWYVSPGRKVDTNPLFPLDHIRSRILGRSDPAEEGLAEQEVLSAIDEMVITSTPGDTLNMRRWPSFNPNVVAQIPDETRLPVLSSVTVNGRNWIKVLYGGVTGWIVARYADPIITSETSF